MSPERLFLQLAIVAMEISKAEQLAISVGLDLTLLAERAGDHLLKLGHISQAISSYALSKVQIHLFLCFVFVLFKYMFYPIIGSCRCTLGAGSLVLKI